MNKEKTISASMLLERARTGEETAIEELLSQHDTKLRAAIDINVKWRSVLEIEDILQVTYMEAVLGLTKYQGDADGFGSWLKSIAINNLRDAIKTLERKKRPQPDQRISVPAGQDSILWLWNFLTGSSVSPSGLSAQDEIRSTLESHIKQLPEAYAETVRLIHFQGHSIEVAANIMDRTYGAVYLLHQRALDRMRALLGNESQFFSR